MKKLIVLIAAMLFGLSFCMDIYAATNEKRDEPQAPRIIPKKISVDTIGDGKPNRFEYYDTEGIITKVETDADGDGIIDETTIYEKGKPVKSVRDTKKAGKPDVWIEYQ